MSRVRVRLFAGLAEQAGISETELTLPDGLVAEDLRKQIAAAFPDIGGLPIRIAVDGVLLQGDERGTQNLNDGSEVVVFPPFGGG